MTPDAVRKTHSAYLTEVFGISNGDGAAARYDIMPARSRRGLAWCWCLESRKQWCLVAKRYTVESASVSLSLPD